MLHVLVCCSFRDTCKSVCIHSLICKILVQTGIHPCGNAYAHPQVKCARYWPEKLHDSLTVENKFRVTFSSNMPFAEYEFRKFKLENVSSFTYLTLFITLSPFSPTLLHILMSLSPYLFLCLSLSLFSVCCHTLNCS